MENCFIKKCSFCCNVNVNVQCSIYVGFTTIVGIIVGFNAMNDHEDPNSFYCDSTRKFFFIKSFFIISRLFSIFSGLL